MGGDIDAYCAPCALLAQHAMTEVVFVEYTFVPFKPIAEIVDEVRRALDAVPRPYAIAADSAGGFLALAAALCAEEKPVATVLWSPVAATGPDRQGRHQLDCLCEDPLLPVCLVEYSFERIGNWRHPLEKVPLLECSELRELQNVRIVTADDDALVPDSEALASRLGCNLELVADVLHAYPVFPEAVVRGAKAERVATAAFLVDALRGARGA